MRSDAAVAAESEGAYLTGAGSAELAEDIEDSLDGTRRELRAKHVQQMEREGSDRAQCLAFLDAITHVEEIGDRVVGIIRSAEETRQAA